MHSKKTLLKIVETISVNPLTNDSFLRTTIILSIVINFIPGHELTSVSVYPVFIVRHIGVLFVCFKCHMPFLHSKTMLSHNTIENIVLSTDT